MLLLHPNGFVVSLRSFQMVKQNKSVYSHLIVIALLIG
jgi:hypothetical protein